MEKETIVLLTYRDHTQDKRHAACVERLRTELGVVVLDVTGSSHIDIARSQLATAAMGLGADVVVFIDSDIVFDPHDVARIADVARETLGVVGAPYSLRGLGIGVGVGVVPQDDHVTFFEGGGLYEVSDVLGMGFTAIHRQVFDRIAEIPGYEPVITPNGECVPFFQKLILNGRWDGEDLSFCRAARSVGAAVHLDTRFRVTHLGVHAFRVEDACKQKRPDEATLKVRAKLHQ